MGRYSVDACRIEKGFRHRGRDIGPDVTPREAGLGFAVNWSQEFVGRPVLGAQHGAGVSRRLCLFAVEGAALILHDEPIREGGAVVGLSTSGARGACTGLTLALGLISVARDARGHGGAARPAPGAIASVVPGPGRAALRVVETGPHRP